MTGAVCSRQRTYGPYDHFFIHLLTFENLDLVSVFYLRIPGVLSLQKQNILVSPQRFLTRLPWSHFALTKHGKSDALLHSRPFTFTCYRLGSNTLNSWSVHFYNLRRSLCLDDVRSLLIWSTPATDKKSETGEDDRLFYAVSEMQGWRISSCLVSRYGFTDSPFTHHRPCPLFAHLFIQPWKTLMQQC
jgi:hypothetical protein